MSQTVDALGFYTEVCSRCHGTGHYSRCQMHGTTCFKCEGKKMARTKKGAKAYAAYIESLSVPISTLAIGDSFKTDRNSRCFVKLLEVNPHLIGTSLQEDGTHKEFYGNAYVYRNGPAGNCSLVCEPDYMVRKAWESEEKKAKLAAALKLQG